MGPAVIIDKECDVTADAIAQLNSGYPVLIDIPVAWGDMDAFQHVNNTVYFRWMESGRIAYFTRMAVPGFRDLSGIGPILASTQCRYRLPLTFPDTVTVASRIVSVGEDRMTMEQIIVSHGHGKVAAVGRGVIVTYDYVAGRKAPLPERVRARVEEIEGRHKRRIE